MSAEAASAFACLWAGLLLLMLLFPTAARGADLFLDDETEIYAVIDKLNAMGALPGFMANTRPYSMRMLRAAAETAGRDSAPGEFDGELLAWIADYASPAGTGRVAAGGSFADTRSVPANNEGVPRPDGWSVWGSAAVRYEFAPWLSAQAREVSFFGEDGDDGNRVLDTSVEAGHRYFSAEAGKISTWYGPGRHGALIFTNNSAPYPGARIHNPEPIPMPGWLSFLGKAQYDLFVARLEKGRPIPHSLLSGVRIAFKPAEWLELGTSRAMHFGGEGRGNGVSDWWNAFTGKNENADDPSRNPGNQIAGFDVDMVLPFRWQPVEVYMEAAGEDEATAFGFFPVPSRWAFLEGIFLPSLGGWKRADLRVEAAQNHLRDNGPAWYTHIKSNEGYAHRYRGDILGHPMGTDATDLFAEFRCFFLPSTFMKLDFDRTQRYFAGLARENRATVSAGVIAWLTRNWRGEVNGAVERITGNAGTSGTDFSAWIAVAYRVTSNSPAASGRADSGR